MSKRVTIKDVAARAQVSYQTVSKVINKQAQVSKDTEERIWQAVRELGYHPDHRARNLRKQSSHLLGYSWEPSPFDEANPVLDLFLQSMMDAAERAGYHVMVFPRRQGQDDIATYRELIHTGQVDGFVLSSIEFDDPHILMLQQQSFPFVAFGRSNPDWEFPYVDVDGGEGLRMATRHLLDLGHRKIAVLAWPESSGVGCNRLAGYLAAMQAAGITPQPGWIARGESQYTFGLEATTRWLDLPPEQRPTAIVALNDASAIGAMHAVQARGLRVGADVAITGFDDAPMVQYLTPSLTSIRQPVWQVGQRVITMLIGIIQGPPPAERQALLPPELIVRASSGGAFGCP